MSLAAIGCFSESFFLPAVPMNDRGRIWPRSCFEVDADCVGHREQCTDRNAFWNGQKLRDFFRVHQDERCQNGDEPPGTKCQLETPDRRVYRCIETTFVTLVGHSMLARDDMHGGFV